MGGFVNARTSAEDRRAKYAVLSMQGYSYTQRQRLRNWTWRHIYLFIYANDPQELAAREAAVLKKDWLEELRPDFIDVILGENFVLDPLFGAHFDHVQVESCCKEHQDEGPVLKF